MTTASPAYLELVDFIAAGTTPETIIAFRPSQQAQARVASLIARKQEGSLSPDEQSELEDFLHLEHILIMVKAQARRNLQIAD